MKNQIFYIFLVLSLNKLNAQQLQKYNFNELTIGNVTTDTGGEAMGQGALSLFASNENEYQIPNGLPNTTNNTDVSNAKIFNFGSSQVNTLRIEGPNGTQGYRFLASDMLKNTWPSRTPGNDVIEIEFDIHPGSASTSENLFGVCIFNFEFTKILAGIMVRASDKKLILYKDSAVGESTNDGRSFVELDIQIPENVWSRLHFTYNKTTGEIKVKNANISGTEIIIPGIILAEDPVIISFTALASFKALSTNNSAASMDIDNFTAKAIPSQPVLNADTFDKKEFSVYPIPSSDYLNIDKNSLPEIKGIYLTDLNARIVKAFSNTDKLDISDLSNGIYILNLEMEKTILTKKIIKH